MTGFCGVALAGRRGLASFDGVLCQYRFTSQVPCNLEAELHRTCVGASGRDASGWHFLLFLFSQRKPTTLAGSVLGLVESCGPRL